jgi:hypothetical protein
MSETIIAVIPETPQENLDRKQRRRTLEDLRRRASWLGLQITTMRSTHARPAGLFKISTVVLEADKYLTLEADVKSGRKSREQALRELQQVSDDAIRVLDAIKEKSRNTKPLAGRSRPGEASRYPAGAA